MFSNSHTSRSQLEFRREAMEWTQKQLREYQWERLEKLLTFLRSENSFLRARIENVGRRIVSWADWEAVPLLSKGDLFDPNDRIGCARHHTWPPERYQRFHRTSGTMGRPLVILDTDDDWRWWIDTWQYVLDAAEVGERDRVFMAFSFGPFIGFWSAHEACLQRKAMVIPGGGLSTAARLDLIQSSGATVVCCTPSYALHMAEIASQSHIDLRSTDVRQIIVAGEPGGSTPSIRSRIEEAWNAKVTDHAGGTEVGPWGVGTPEGDGLFVIETEFIPEFIPVSSIETGASIPFEDCLPGSTWKGELSELVLTSLGRFGCPVLRYRTGDLVRPVRDPRCSFVRLEGGVLGRVDDMLIIRGVNVFPSSIEAIVLSFPEVEEFRIIATRDRELDQLCIEVEDRLHSPERISQRIQIRLGLRVDVVEVPIGTFPRSEGKSRRFIDRRGR